MITYAITWLDCLPDWKVVELFLQYMCDEGQDITACADSFHACNPDWTEKRVSNAFFQCLLLSERTTW
jgi:hypothetical protein